MVLPEPAEEGRTPGRGSGPFPQGQQLMSAVTVSFRRRAPEGQSLPCDAHGQ